MFSLEQGLLRSQDVSKKVGTFVVAIKMHKQLHGTAAVPLKRKGTSKEEVAESKLWKQMYDLR